MAAPAIMKSNFSAFNNGSLVQLPDIATVRTLIIMREQVTRSSVSTYELLRFVSTIDGDTKIEWSGYAGYLRSYWLASKKKLQISVCLVQDRAGVRINN